MEFPQNFSLVNHKPPQMPQINLVPLRIKTMNFSFINTPKKQTIRLLSRLELNYIEDPDKMLQESDLNPIQCQQIKQILC